MLPQFDVTTLSSQVFWFFICFILTLIGVFKLVLPAYKKILDGRINILQKDIDETLALQKEILRLKKERSQKIEQVQSEIDDFVEKSMKNVLNQQDGIFKKARQNYENSVKALEESMENQKKLILSNIEPFIEKCIADVLKKFMDDKK